MKCSCLDWLFGLFFFFKQKTAYEMRISDWSSDVCSSDLSAWLDGRLTLNANAFYVDWKDQQVSANFGMSIYDTHIVNAGSSHLYGFEIEATHSPSGAFDWYASVGYSRTRFDEFATPVGSVTDYDGLEFAHAPPWKNGSAQ